MSHENGNQPQDLDKISDLIRKCLALSESPNENEAAIAMAKAQELLEKYNLSLSEVKQDSTAIPDIIEGEVSYESKEWLRSLIHIVAKHNFCKTVGHSYSSNQSIIGRYPNVCATVEMSNWLRQQIERICLAETSGTVTPHTNLGNGKLNFSGRCPTDLRSYRVGFLTGIVARINQRLDELARQRRVETPSLTALTVNLMDESERFMQGLYPRLVSHAGSPVNGLGYFAGTAAGDKVSLTPASRHVEGGPLRLTGGS